MGTGVILSGLALVAGGSMPGSAAVRTPVRSHHILLEADRSAVDYWTAQVEADSQLLATSDLQEAEAARALPPCAQTPAINPPCTGFAKETAGAMAPQVEMYGQAAEDAQMRILKDQIWLQALRHKLKRDESAR